MTRTRRIVLSSCAALSALGLALSPGAAQAVGGAGAPSPFTFAVIGDVPYGAAQVEAFPGWVDDINADPDASLAFHVGDIKNGSSRCDDSYFAMIRTQFDRFRDPLLYTPGDNEWTDCHRENNGSYDPLERLDTLREVFYPEPGTTLGRGMPVAMPDPALPENVALHREGVSMGVIHVVGSNNSLKPWSGLGYAAPTAAQVAEERARMDASVALVRETFAEARRRDDRAVAIFQQADMFDPTYTPTWSDISAFKPLVQALIEESSAFDGEVYLFDGDSHVYNVDRPLAEGSVWLSRYGVTGSAENLTRVTVDGSANNTDWLKVTVNRPGAAEVLSWEQVPYTD